MSRKEFEIFLYKNKLNECTLIDIIDNLSSKSISYLMRDLGGKTRDTNTSDILYIFTDGGCKNNGKKNCKGGYGIYITDDKESPFYKMNYVELIKDDPTNQKAELLGINKALCILKENIQLLKNTDIKKIVIVSDSMYSIKCIKEWSKTWIKNNWKTSKGEKVKNDTIIKDAIDTLELLRSRDFDIDFKHTFSHTVEPKNRDTLEYVLWRGNDIVDKMINKILL